MAGAADETVIDFARSERRLLLTEDKDFGQLVFAAAKQNSGVILIRYPASARSALSAAVLKLLSDSGESLYSRFAVLEPGRVRVTQLVTKPDARSSLKLGIERQRHSLCANRVAAD